MVLIAQISELAIWKKAMKEEGILSMKDLLERGTGIERCLEDAVDDVNVWLTKLANTDCAEFCISRCFVLAAQTYLHVTISGPYPSLPEITASVTNTIVAFQELKDKKMMRNLVWPFCVTGCSATREHEGGRRRGRDGDFVESVGGGEGVLEIKGRREGCRLGSGDAEFGGVGIISLREVKVNLTKKPRLICPINSGG
jgi:hypothetical protein